MNPRNIIITATALATLGLGGDAAIYNGTEVVVRTVPIAEEIVDIRQVENVVEATFPWKDQAGLKVKYDLGEPTIAERVADKRKQEVITETVTDFDGGFKVDLLLNEMPNTNVFCYAIEGAESYDFFYQPPLTAEEIAEGDYRPPEIEGSYAVYHKTLKNHQLGRENYATGKVMHIPRPQVWSMLDVETKVWADMQYDNGQLCVTVPQDFLDKAKYPVRVDPTFGYTSIGGSSVNTSQISCSIFTMNAETGDVTSISTYRNVGAGTQPAGSGIYSDSSGSPYAKLAEDSGNVTITTTANWYTTNISVSLSASTPYWLCSWSSGATNHYYDTGATNQRAAKVATFETWPDPYGTPSFTNRQLSIYATYTASGGGGDTPVAEDIIWFD